MRLPNAERAIVSERKITNYLLSLTHQDGRGKALFFMRFGFTVTWWEILADAFRHHAIKHDVITVTSTPYGTRYVVEGPLIAPDGRQPDVRVIWFIETGETVPQLVTAYPLKESAR